MRPLHLPPAFRFAPALLICLSLAAWPSAAVAAEATEPHLHQAFKACGKKWVKKARRLTQEQLRWLLARSHRIYHVDVGAERIATLEVLSAGSFRDCDLDENWDKRETSVRVTLYRPDGSTRVRMSNFAIDDVFFNAEPAFYPQIGRVLLRGVDVDGTKSNRWLEIEALGSIYAHRVAERRAPAFGSETAPAPVLAAIE